MKKTHSYFFLAAFAFLVGFQVCSTFSHVKMQAAHDAIASIDVTCSNVTLSHSTAAATSTKFFHGLCDVAPKALWFKSAANGDAETVAEKFAETPSKQLLKRDRDELSVSWNSKLIAMFALIREHGPVHLLIDSKNSLSLDEIDVSKKSADTQELDRLLNATDADISTNDTASATDNGVYLRGDVDSGGSSVVLSSVSAEVPPLPVETSDGHRAGDSVSSAFEPQYYPAEGPRNTDRDTSDDSSSFLSVLKALTAGKISEGAVAADVEPAGFETGEGAVYVDKVIAESASRYEVAGLSTVEGLEPHTVIFGGNTLHQQGNSFYQILNTDIRTTLKNTLSHVFDFDFDTPRLMKRQAITEFHAYSESDTSGHTGMILGSVFGISFSIVCMFGMYACAKHLAKEEGIRRRLSETYEIQRAHKQVLRDNMVARLQTRNIDESQMLTYGEMLGDRAPVYGPYRPPPVYNPEASHVEFVRNRASSYTVASWIVPTAPMNSPVKSNATREATTLVDAANGTNSLAAPVPIRQVSLGELRSAMDAELGSPPRSPPRIQLRDDN